MLGVGEEQEREERREEGGVKEEKDTCRRGVGKGGRGEESKKSGRGEEEEWRKK